MIRNGCPFGPRDLARMVEAVACNERLGPAGRHFNADMAGRMPFGWNQLDPFQRLARRLNQICQTRRHYRLDRLLMDKALRRLKACTITVKRLFKRLRIDRRLLGLCLPIFIFLASKQIARIGECDPPFAIHKVRVDPDMIEMQMGAQHQINRVRIKACTLEFIEQSEDLVVPIGIARQILIVAHTGVDHDQLAAQFNHKALDKAQHRAVLRNIMRGEPWNFGQGFGLRFVDQPVHGERLLDHRCDLCIANLPLLHCPLPPQNANGRLKALLLQAAE